MALLGPKEDVRRLTRLVAEALSKVNVEFDESAISVDGDTVKVGLDDLPDSQLGLVLELILAETAHLWTHHLRFRTSDSAHLSKALRLLNRWSVDAEWRVSRREGRPYIDLKKKARHLTAPSASVTVDLHTSRESAHEEPPYGELITDWFGDLVGLFIEVVLISPLALIVFALVQVTIDNLPYEQATAVFGLIILLLLLASLAVLALVRRLVRPNRHHCCKHCSHINRLLPFMGRDKLGCYSCGSPIYGAWPIKDEELFFCPHCKEENLVFGDDIIQGRIACGLCDEVFFGNATKKRK